MKKIFRFAILALAAVSCTREEINLIDNARTGDTREISVGLEGWQYFSPGSKTYLSGSSVLWSAESVDKSLLVFDTEGGKNVFTSSSTVAEAVRSFSGTLTEGSSVRYALWTGKAPDDNDITLNGYVLSGPSLAINNPQNIDVAGSFQLSSNIAVMRPGDEKMRNVLGYIKFVIPAGNDGHAAIKSVTISADENLVGNISIRYSGSDPVASIASNGSKSVTVNTRYVSGSGYEAGAVYAVVVPGTYHNLKIKVTPFADGAAAEDAATAEPFTLSCKGTVEVQRSKYTSAGELPVAKPEDPTIDPNVVGEWKVINSNSSGPLHIEGNVLYAGAGGKIRVYDITEPFNPVLKNEIAIVGLPRKMRTYNGRLFVTARETGTWIYDISNPYTPTLLSHYDGVELSTGIEIAGNCMFLGMRQMGVEFVDISDITRPQHIRIIQTGEAQSVFYADGYLYSGQWTTGELSVFKVDDLSNISLVTTVKLYGSTDGIWITGDRLYASTGHNAKNGSPYTGGNVDGAGHDGKGHGIEIWDISNRAAPKRVSECRFQPYYKAGTDWWQNRPSGDCKTLFCADVYNGLYIVDISDEKNPRPIYRWVDGLGKVDVDETVTVPSSNKPCESVAVADGVLYLSCGSLYAIECSRANRTVRGMGALPSGESARYEYATASTSNFKAWLPTLRGAVRDAAVSPDGSALFVGCGQAGLATVKMNGSGELYAVNEMAIPFAGGVSVLGSRLYVSEAEKGVGVYKIGADLSLTRERYIREELASEDRYRYSCWLTTPNDKYLVSANRVAGWQYLAIGGTEDAPTYTWRGSKSWNVNYNNYISDYVCAGDKLPYATRSGLMWIDLASTSSVSFTQYSDLTNSIPDGVTNFKDGNALATADKRFKLIASGTNTVSQASGTNETYSGIPRWDGGDKVLLCNYVNMFVGLYDMADVSSPARVFQESVKGHPEPGLFWNGKAVVPCGYQGLLVEK